jgi:hypothetical protein
VDSGASTENPYTSWLKSNIGVPLARAGINVVTGIPFAAMDLGVGARNIGGDLYNKAMGNPATPDYELPSHVLQQAIQSYLPAPTTTSGRIGEVANSMILGAGAAFAGAPGLSAPTYNPGNVPANFVPPVSSAGDGITRGQQSALDAGRSLGFEATPGQASGSPFLQRIEARMESVPWLSGAFDRLKANNRNVLAQTASGSIGEQGLPDSATLDRAASRLGDFYDSIKDPNVIAMIDPKEASGAIDSAEQSILGQLPGNSTLRDNRLVKMVSENLEKGATSGEEGGYYLPGYRPTTFDDPRLAAAAKAQYGYMAPPGISGGVSVNGAQLGEWSHKLGAAAYQNMHSASGNDRALGSGLYQIKNYVDGLWRSTMAPETAAQFDTVNAQYHNLMTLAKPNVINPVIGTVSGPNLASNLFRADKSGYAFGRNSSDLYQAAQFSKAFPSAVGDSGTATRSEGLIKSLLLGIPGNAASAAYVHGGNALVQSLPPTASGGLQPAMQGVALGLPALAGHISDYLEK